MEGQSTEYLRHINVTKDKGRRETVTAQRRPKGQNNEVQCGVLGWTPDQGKDTGGKKK